MKRKIMIVLAVVLLMTAFFIGCKKDESVDSAETSATAQTAQATDAATSDEEQSQKPQGTPQPPADEVHAGLVFSGTGYETEMVKNSVRTLMAVSSLKIPVTEMEASAENPSEAINSLANEGCEIIFAVGIESKYLKEAAKQHPDVKFEIYGGQDTGGLPNVSCFYSRMYQQQYLNGMIAGYMSQAGSIGYLAQSAQNTDIRRVNAFALGAKAANPDSVVHFAWAGEGEADGTSEALCSKGCDVIFSMEPEESLLGAAVEKGISVIAPKNSGEGVVTPMIEPSVFSYVMDKARSTAFKNYTSNDMLAGWVPIAVYEIDFDDYPMLTGEEKNLVQDAASKMALGEWDVFTGPIIDKYGQTIIPEGTVIPDEDLIYMLWYVGNIEAMPPPMG